MATISRRMAELVTAIFLLFATVLLFAQTFTFARPPIKGYPGAAFFPRLALGIAAVFIVVWIAGLMFRRASSLPGSGDEQDAPLVFEYRDYLVTLGLSLGFVVGLDLVGFEISCFLVLAIILCLRIQSRVVAIVGAAVTTLALYAIFVLLLNVSLPLLLLPRFVSF